jgi:hypothetical protein
MPQKGPRIISLAETGLMVFWLFVEEGGSA